MTKSTKWLIAVFLIGLTAMIATRIANANHLGLEDHVPSGTLFLTLSIGLILLIGNIIVTEAWTFAAEKTKNETVMKFAVRTLNWADVFFTVPGIFIALVSAHMLQEKFNVGDASWALVALVLFASAGVVWGFLLVPLQNALVKKTRSNKLNDSFYSLLHVWYVAGIAATLLTIASISVVIFAIT